jgi:hypothetical protein
MSRTRTIRQGGRPILAAAFLTIMVCGLSATLWGADRTKPAAKRRAAPQAEAVDLFAAVKQGDIEVKLIPNDDKEANVIITNKTKRPLSVRLPAAFAGMPVLAQPIGGLGGEGIGRGDGDNNNNNQNQALGGGFGGGGLGGGLGGIGGGLGGGGFGGAFNIAPEKVGRLKVACVCLEHGKKDPNPRVAYEMKPIDQFTKDAKVHLVIKLLASGKVNQRIAQAAAWHFANGMSWQQLAAKKIDRLGRPDEPYFHPAELQAALRVAALTEKAAREQKTSSDSSSDTLSQR